MDSVEFAQHVKANRFSPTLNLSRRSAFEALTLSENDRNMLQSHYSAPDRTVTASQLARAAGFVVYGAANMHYGRLAHRVADELGINPKHPLSALVSFAKPNGQWEWTMRPQVVASVESLGIVDLEFAVMLAEEIESSQPLTEGTTYRITVNAYERNSVARQKCLAHFGYACACCKMTFHDTYGEEFATFIHVHHLTPLASIKDEYQIDPVVDLAPACPNCHAVMHLRNPPYSISEVQQMINR